MWPACVTGLFENLNLGTGATAERLQAEIETDQAVPLLFSGQTVGCVKRAHDLDENLAAPVMLENLACKGTAFGGAPAIAGKRISGR